MLDDSRVENVSSRVFYKFLRSVSYFTRGDCLHFVFLAKIRCKHRAVQSVW